MNTDVKKLWAFVIIFAIMVFVGEMDYQDKFDNMELTPSQGR